MGEGPLLWLAPFFHPNLAETEGQSSLGRKQFFEWKAFIKNMSIYFSLSKYMLCQQMRNLRHNIQLKQTLCSFPPFWEKVCVSPDWGRSHKYLLLIFLKFVPSNVIHPVQELWILFQFYFFCIFIFLPSFGLLFIFFLPLLPFFLVFVPV